MFIESEDFMNNEIWQGDLKLEEYHKPLISTKLKNFLKKLATISLSVSMAFSFAGCGEKPVVEQPPVDNDPSITTPVDPNSGTDKEDPGTQTDPTKPTEPDDKEDPTKPAEPDDKEDPGKEEPGHTDPVTPPVEEKFSLAENKDKIIENVMPLLDIYKIMKIGNNATVEQVYDLYITNDESATTIGAVFSGISSVSKVPYLEYGTVTLPENADLSFEKISKSPIEYNNIRDLKFTQLYTFKNTTANYLKYQDTIEKIQKKLFDNYENALWLGWTGRTYPQFDGHQIVCYDGKTIRSILVNIDNDGGQLTFPQGAVDKYFVNNNYTIVNDKVEATLPTNTLQAQIEKELQEKEQQA